jgi:hypothetical protein|tara:strand:- start:481 stop:801 length:321 start_codon:yes stop_codon:yes gene_type:complete
MFKLVYHGFRKSTFFEKLLLVVGLSVGILGFWLINSVYLEEPGISWQFIMSIFLWMLLIFIVILTDSNESIKEELSAIIKEHMEETKLMKQEIMLLNEGLSRIKKK